MRVAVVLAKAMRQHGDIGRRICLVCPRDELTYPLRTVGLDQPGTMCSSLTDAGWYGAGRRAVIGAAHGARADVSRPASAALTAVGS
jgi:hypothetical protein